MYQGQASGAHLPQQTISPQRTRGTLLILCYHAIEDTTVYGPIADYGLPLAEFASQMRTLRRWGFRFPSVDEVYAHLALGGSLPGRNILITFDDAYRSIIPALAEMKQAGIGSGIVFVVGGQIGGTNEWDRSRGVPPLSLMTAEELQEAQSQGFEIGAHSMTHPDMSRLDESELRRETAEALDSIAAAGLSRPRSFAYPHGSHSEAVRGAVARAGGTMGFACAAGLARPGCDLMAVPRLEILRRHKGLRFNWYLLRTLLQS
jgi:peptidoglycan/xylan/chitin deacetylase (PgdA/CDA1 family)